MWKIYKIDIFKIKQLEISYGFILKNDEKNK